MSDNSDAHGTQNAAHSVATSTETVPGALFRYRSGSDGRHEVLHVSPACFDIWEVSAAQLEQDVSQAWRMIDPDGEAGAHASMTQAAQALTPWQFKWAITTPSGHRKWLQGIGHLHREADGGPHWHCVILDITERETLEEVSLRHTLRLRQVLDVTGAGVWDWQIGSDVVIQGRSWLFMLGLDEDQASKPMSAFVDLIHPRDRDHVRASLRASLAGQASFASEYRMNRSDGSQVWVEARGDVVERDASGRAKRMLGSLSDITARREAAVALNDQRRQLQALLDNISCGVIVHRADTSIVDANPAACRITGLTLDQLQGKVATDPHWGFLEEDGSVMPLPRFPVMQVLQTGAPVNKLLGGIRRPDLPRPVWVQVDAYPLRDSAGQIEQVVVTFADITERHQADEQRRDSEAMKSAVLDSLTAHVVVLDPEGCVVSANEAWRRYGRENGASDLYLDPLGHNYLQICAEAIGAPRGEEAALALEGIRAVLAGQRREFHLEYPCHAPHEKRWFRMSVTPVASERGGAVVSHVEVTELKLAEQAAQRLNRSLRVLGSSAMSGINVQDEAAYLTRVCEAVVAAGSYRLAWAGLGGLGPSPPLQVVARAGTGEPAAVEAVAQALRTGETQVGHDGTASLALPLRNGPLNLGVLVLHAVEVDAFTAEELPPLEELARNVAAAIEALRARTERDAAEGASRAKSEFLANMSHEIRTPLNAIVGLNYLIRRDGVAPEQAARLDRLDGATRHLLGIVDDILDLSKIEAGRLQLECTDFHLATVFDAVHSIIAEAARTKGIDIFCDSSSVPVWLRGDPTRLRQALLNFAANAVKFTERGSISLRARLLQADGDRLVVCFSVQDSGVGISPEQRGRLFRAFEQADASVTRKFGGTGLGLAITSRLAALMGGECGADSTPGVGSTFWFTAHLQRGQGVLPATPFASAATNEMLLREQHGAAHVLLVEDNEVKHGAAHVLLVEDNEVNREVAMAMLQGAGLRVDVATNGGEAVAKAKTTVYDLVLMDMQMPVLSGLDATRAIRALPGWADRPILALTANAFFEDRLACTEAGMNDFIGKPMEARPDFLVPGCEKFLLDNHLARFALGSLQSDVVARVVRNVVHMRSRLGYTHAHVPQAHEVRRPALRAVGGVVSQ